MATQEITPEGTSRSRHQTLHTDLLSVVDGRLDGYAWRGKGGLILDILFVPAGSPAPDMSVIQPHWEKYDPVADSTPMSPDEAKMRADMMLGTRGDE